VSVGFEVVASSRVHSAENDFSNCTKVYEVESGSNVYESDTSNNTYNEGGADENGLKYNLKGGGIALHTYSDSVSTYLAHKITSIDDVDNVAATTITHHTITGFLKSDEFDTKGWVKAVIVGDISGTNGSKTLILQLDGNDVSKIIIPAARAGDYVAELSMSVLATSSQRLWATCILDDGGCISNAGTASIDLGFTSAKDLTIKSTLAHDDDEINVRYIEIWRGEA
jgi:hypothetical protein